MYSYVSKYKLNSIKMFFFSSGSLSLSDFVIKNN